MTEYYTNKSDFEQGKRIGWFEDNVSQVKDLLKDISETAEIVKSNDLSHLYIAKGGATLGKDMPEKTFVDSEHTVLDVMEEMKRVHREIVQNIENKYISGLEDAMEALNKINEGKNKYKSEHLTYEETYTYQTSYQTGYGIQTVKGKRKAYYSLSDILNSDKSPISSAAAKYQDKLKVAKENLAKLEAEDKETYDKIKDLSEKELVETFFPTELGEYKRLKSTWSKDNEWWLGWVDIGVKVVGTAALVVGTFASGGTLAPVALALGTTLLGGEAAYRAISGETITGDVLTNEQRIWAGAEAVTTLVSGGLGSYLKGASIAERTVSQGVLNADKVARFGANAYDVAQFGHDFIEDPQMALTNLATSQLIGRTVGHLGQRFQAYRASKAADVNLGSGKATSYKGSIQERLSNTWTDVKTKAGNVRAQASQSWDDFKTKANNTKNRALASGAEKVSEKLDNLNAAWGAQKQNFQRNLAAMQGNLAPELQLAGGAPGIGVKPNFSESMENLSQKIQQFSVKRRQQIQDFEGVGGNSGSKTVFSNTIETKTPETIIAERTKGLDLVPHPTTQKQLSPKKMKELKQKIADRTITREEYEQYDWNKRFTQRRNEGVESFWRDERVRLSRGEKGTRNWSEDQIKDILSGKRAKFDGKTLQGHHTYSASQYPHLANRSEVIYPVTFNEHFRGWHGGNWKTSLPGKRIDIIDDF
ncbi:hypothetical protein HMPREF9381_1106 [Streptococcus sanguinis SK72]|jgi:hypothetical protein|uniref:Tox-GHH domain-containing protein n=3 Tax=Streptococcus sanguinis TaxID=1305 RepID=F0I165_STRSA|nr:hypothetical protein [Streptococcus sanguinis]EFX94399.1 hypothetical protein HMPREF9398_1168 [Streptococcus sanguinis VMC66]EGC22980.1 hypothetical protein HMPREF9388_0592 [Streptococcus sanguinis SK353]EGD29593.1 hypothetical protein HMPREF9381_1106 [Streptococcus sanguinis SK72]ETD07801.1 hypothetical protein HMPREF1196_00857 [Streptococcus sanguinis CC94A]QKQ43746.1 hypothetical protein FOC72_04100 [Streptococcus sanguinis]